MKGVDMYRRPFVACKLTATSFAETFEFVGTFFQRYTDEETEWAYGTYAPLNLLFHDSRIRPQHHNDLEQRLCRLLRREVVYNIDDSRGCDYIQGNGLYTIAFRPDALVIGTGVGH